MTIARVYRMTAASGAEEQLVAALNALTDALRPIDGFEGADFLQELEAPGRIVFVERWQSIEAHEAGGAALAKEALAPVMAALAGRPEAYYARHSGQL